MAPRSWYWTCFTRGQRKFRNNTTNFEAYCVGCVAFFTKKLTEADQQAIADGAHIGTLRSKTEILKAACKLAKPICGRPSTFRPHIRHCPHVSLEAKERLQAEDEGNITEDQPMQPPPTSNFPTLNTLVHHPKVHPVALTRSEHKEFELDLLHLFVANNFPIYAVDSPQTQLFFRKWLPGPDLPARQALGGRILNSAVQQSKIHIQAAVKGKMAVGISDGWKNISKTSLLASMINVDYKAYTVRVNDISSLRKTADNHLKIVQEVIAYCTAELDTNIIGWVSDAGGESRAMRVRLHKVQPELLLFDCWAHQINLIVGDIFKLKIDLVAAGADAQDIAKWFLSHSFALGILQDEQTKASGSKRTYMLANITRWTAHYLSTQSLLEDRGPLQATVALHRSELKEIGSKHPERVRKVLDTVEQPDFWRKLEELNAYLQPLAIAQNVAQASDTRLDHVLITLGNLYRIFDRPDINPSIREGVCQSLMRRWSKADQDPFILAVFFNPYIRCSLFNLNNPAFCVSALYTVAKRVFTRVFRKTPESGFFEAFIDYYHSREEFSAEQWHLEDYATMYKNEDKYVNLLALWSALPFPGTVNSYRHQLACLAKLILSVVANSAGAERLFSRMGNIHTKRRNRLHHEKVHNLATVAMDLDAQHQAAGISRKRTRRHFDAGLPNTPPALRHNGELNATQAELSAETDSEASDSDSDVDPVDEAEQAASNLTALAAQLMKAVDDDDDAPEEEEAGNDNLPNLEELAAYEPVRQPRVRLFFGTVHAIPLNEVFDFSDSIPGVADGLDVFWKGGIRNLAKERGIYEAIAQDSTHV